MSYSISRLNDFQLNENIGSKTVRILADQGAFDSDVSNHLEALADDNDQIHVIVSEEGINHFLEVAKSGTGGGYRDRFIKYVEDSYMNGFMLHY